MTDEPNVRDLGPAGQGDLEYDLAHEAVGDPAEGREAATYDEPRAPIEVATETTGYDGDYGYDLAHDIPKP